MRTDLATVANVRLATVANVRSGMKAVEKIHSP
jgi:hypothetical protein